MGSAASIETAPLRPRNIKRTREQTGGRIAGAFRLFILCARRGLCAPRASGNAVLRQSEKANYGRSVAKHF